jgi:hypothetical protein
MRECLTMMDGAGERLGIHGVLDAFAELAMTEGQVRRAVRLAGAADGLRRRQGTRSWPVLARRRETWLAHARTMLGDATLQSLLDAGGGMSADDAVAFARGGADAG